MTFLYAFIYDTFALYTFHLRSYFKIRKLKVISISKAPIDRHWILYVGQPCVQNSATHYKRNRCRQGGVTDGPWDDKSRQWTD